MSISKFKCSRSSSTRGSLSLGFASLTTLLFVMCGLVLQNSLETYRSANLGVHKLQARCAAEGIAIAASQAPANALCNSAPMEIGNCLVEFTGCTRQANQTSGSQALTFRVHAGSLSNRRPAFTAKYQADVQQTDSGAVTVQSLELVP